MQRTTENSSKKLKTMQSLNTSSKILKNTRLITTIYTKQTKTISNSQKLFYKQIPHSSSKSNNYPKEKQVHRSVTKRDYGHDLKVYQNPQKLKSLKTDKLYFLNLKQKSISQTSVPPQQIQKQVKVEDNGMFPNIEGKKPKRKKIKTKKMHTNWQDIQQNLFKHTQTHFLQKINKITKKYYK